MTRLVWANSRKEPGTHHGRTHPGKSGRGVVYELVPLDKDAALEAFDAVAVSAGDFSIESRDLSRIDFLFPKPGFLSRTLGPFRPPSVTLDLWFEEEPTPPLDDVVVLDPTTAREFLAFVFDDVPDDALWDFLRTHRRAVP